VLDQVRVVGEPRVEEVGVRRYTYLFFQFCDDLSGEIVLRLVLIVLVFVVGFLVLTKRERIGGFVVGVEGVDEILSPDGFAFSVIVELPSTGKFLPGSLEDRIVDGDIAVL
jgi:hypothetical protein